MVHLDSNQLVSPANNKGSAPASGAVFGALAKDMERSVFCRSTDDPSEASGFATATRGIRGGADSNARGRACSPVLRRREFLIATGAFAVSAAIRSSAAPVKLERQVGLVAATLAQHQDFRKKGGLELMDLPKAIHGELGMTVIDMNTMNFAELNERVAGQFRTAADKEGCVLTNLKLNQRGLDIGDADEGKRKHALDVYRRSVDAAAIMGMRWVRPLPTAKAPQQSHLIDSLRRLDDYARPKGIRVLIENFGWMQADADSVVKLINAVDRDLPASPDTGNWNSNAVRYAGLELTFPLAATCDFKAKTLGPDFEHKAYDLKRCFDIGWKAGFRGPWCIEHGNNDLKKLWTELRWVRDQLLKWMKEAA